jgi:hypothetical protein
MLMPSAFGIFDYAWQIMCKSCSITYLQEQLCTVGLRLVGLVEIEFIQTDVTGSGGGLSQWRWLVTAVLLEYGQACM